jgi:hypothetical protein
MKGVIALAKGNKGDDEVVPQQMSVIKQWLSEPMHKRVEHKYAGVDHAYVHHTCIHVLATPIAPEIYRDCSQHHEADEKDEQHVPPLLPVHNRALAKVTHISYTQPAPQLDEHPSYMAPSEPTIF